MSSPLRIKHPELRPRILDPSLRRAGASNTTTPIADVPGAIAVQGPDAWRGEDLLDADDDVNEFDDEYENDRSDQPSHDGDSAIITNDDDAQERGEIGAIVREQERGDEDDGDGHTRALKSEKRSKRSKRKFQLCLACGILIGVVFAVSYVVIIMLRSRNSMSTPSPVPTQPKFLPTPIPVDDGQVVEDWTLVSEIVGSVDSFGFEVDFNSNATRLAVSAPKAHNGRGQVEVYKRKAPVRDVEEWERLGDPIVGDSEGDFASQGMDLSIDGFHLAVGHPGNGNGFVRVFRFDEGEWKQQGQTLAGPSFMSHFGASVSIGENGNFLLVGAPLGGEEEQGMIQAYKWMPGGIQVD